MRNVILVSAILATLGLAPSPVKGWAPTAACPGQCEGQGGGVCRQYYVLTIGCEAGPNWCAQAVCILTVVNNTMETVDESGNVRDLFDMPICQAEATSKTVGIEASESVDGQWLAIEVRHTREVKART